MIEHFLTYLEVEKRYSPCTVTAYRNDLSEFCGWLGWTIDEYNPAEVTEGDVKEWIVHLMEENNNSPRSVKQKLAALHSLYRFLLRTGKVDKDITLRVHAPKTDKPLPVFFKPAEMEAAAAFDHDADDKESIRNCLIIQMLYQTGMRRAEMAGLKDSDIDTLQGQIRVFGKRSKERIIPIGRNLCDMIERYREAKGGDYGTFFVQWKRTAPPCRLRPARFTPSCEAEWGKSQRSKNTPRTCSGILLPRPCSTTGRTYAPYSSCSGMPRSPQPRFIRILLSNR